MARLKLTPVQAFRLQQAAESIQSVAAEINAGNGAKGDAKFAFICLAQAVRNISEAVEIANLSTPSTQP